MNNDDLTAFLNAHMTKLQGRLLTWIISCAIPMLVAGVVGVMDIKGDIKDGRTDTKIQVNAVYYRLDKKIDSLQSSNDLQFHDIRQQLNTIPAPKTTIIRQTLPQPGAAASLYTMRYVDGQLGFFPVKVKK